MIQTAEATALALRIHAEAAKKQRIAQVQQEVEDEAEEEEPIQEAPARLITKRITTTQQLVDMLYAYGPLTGKDLAERAGIEARAVPTLLAKRVRSGEVLRYANPTRFEIARPPTPAEIADVVRPMVRRYLRDGYQGSIDQWRRLARLLHVG